MPAPLVCWEVFLDLLGRSGLRKELALDRVLDTLLVGIDGGGGGLN